MGSWYLDHFTYQFIAHLSLERALVSSLREMEVSNLWDKWVGEALSKLDSLKLLRSLRPLYLSKEQQEMNNTGVSGEEEYEVFDKMQPWDRSSVNVSISEPTYRKWLLEIPSSGILFSNKQKKILFYFAFIIMEMINDY